MPASKPASRNVIESAAAAAADSRRLSLRRAARAVVEGLEARALFAADPLGSVNQVQTLPFALEFDQPVDGLHDKDGQDIGLTRVQVNRRGLTNSYQAPLLDLNTDLGVLNVTTAGNATDGSNYNGNNTLVNALETTFDATTSGFRITARIKGPLNYINTPDEQAGIYFGPDQDNYVKLVAIAREEGPRLQFVDEQTYNGVYTHSLNSIRDIGKFVNSQTLDLRLEGDAASGRVRAYYSINGATFVKMPAELQLFAEKRAAFFSTTTRGGIITLHHNNTGPMTVSYDRFEIEPGEPLAGRPTVVRTRPGDNATEVARDAFIAADLNLPNAGVDTESLTNNTVKLYRTSDRSLVQSVVNTSGGGDTIVLQPRVLLEANTTYTFEVTDGVKDTAGAAFIPYVATFTTGSLGGDVDPSLAFERVQLAGTGGEQYTAVVMGPGNTALWAGTTDGKILRFPLNANGTVGTARVFTTLQDANVGPRLITGFVFDPAATAENPILYVNHGFADIVNAPDWSSKTTKISGANLETVQDLVVGLPRAAKDHLTNQPSFGPDGALYFQQGSMNAMGAQDVQWGRRDEHLMTAAMLRLDLAKLTPGVPLDVKTEDGGTYNPFAASAPLTIYATGIRNAWDMVWTPEGRLYTATNGSAAGGNTPSTPALPIPGSVRIDGDDDNDPANGHYSAPAVEGANNVSQTMNDYLYRVEAGGYYGQPNPKRYEYVLNGGNPSPEVDPAEVGVYPLGTQPDRNWRGNVFDFGPNLSANGMIQYKNAAAFNGALAGKLMIARFSGGDDIIVLTPGADGAIVQSQTGISGMGNLADPLDLVENPANGFLYIAEYSESDPSQRRISLLRPIPPGPRVVTDKSQLVFSDIIPGGTGDTGSSKTLTLRVTSSGTEPLDFASTGFSVVDDPASPGNDAGLFQILNAGTLPDTLSVGEFADVQVRFTAAEVGIESAFLRIASNDPTYPTLDLPLRAVGTGGTEGANEPSLARILRAYRIPTIVGDGPNDSGDGNNAYPQPSDPSSEEVAMSSMTKAGAGTVNIELLSLQGNQHNGVSSRIGYYTPGNRADKTELFTTGADSRTLSPEVASGTTSFDPGTAAFGLYGVFPPFQDATKDAGRPREVFAEDSLNTWESNASERHKVWFFPLREPDGTIVPDAYIFSFEEFDVSTDANDVVGIIRNVRPVAAGPELGLENRDGLPFSDRLVFSRIQDPINSDNDPPQPDNKVHDTAVLRLRNTGTLPLVIGSVSVQGPFELVNPPAPSQSIAAGSSLDVTVRFIATGGDVQTGTLTIGTDDPDEPVTQVALAGFWQGVSEQNQEPNLFELMSVLGYGTKITHAGQLLTIPGEEGKIRRVGDEVLSPYWRRADASAPVTARQLSAFHNQGSAADLYFHAKGSESVTRIIEHSGNYGQSLLPLTLNESGPAYAQFNPTGTFGWRVDGREWSDPTKNPAPEGQPQDQGHHLRFWALRDRAGQIIPNAYLLAMDYAGINYDYNDNVYLLTNIAPDSGPSAPAGLTAVGAGSVQLDWTDSTEANLAGYNVYSSSSASGPWAKINTNLLTESTFNDIFAVVQAETFYQVKAVDNVGNESSAASASATRQTDSVPPGKPVGLTAVGSETGVSLDWANNSESDLVGYDVSRSNSAGGPWTKISGDSPIQGSDYNDDDAPPGVRSYFQVAAVDTSGNRSSPATVFATRLGQPVTAPAAPTALTATAVSPSEIAVSWEPADGALTYALERRIAGTETWEIMSGNLANPSFNDNGLEPETTYEYQVRAQNEAGSSPNSAPASATTQAAPPPPPPQTRTASVTDVSVSEPASGTAVATFTVSLEAAATQTVTVNYDTADGTALAGDDYNAASGTITFNPGQQTRTVAVFVLADSFNEPAETFTLNLTSEDEGVTIADGQGTATIANHQLPTLPVAGKTKATYTGADGRPVRVSLAGPGTAEVTVLGDGVARVTATGTTAASSLSILGNSAVVGLTVDGPLKTLAGKGVNLVGDASIAGAPRTIQLGSVSGGRTLNLGAGQPVSITLGSVSDLSIVSAAPIKSLKAAQWTDIDTTRDAVRAPSVTAVSTKGDFAADILADNLGKLTVGGALTGSNVRTTGAIGTVTAGTMRNNQIFAGVRNGLNTLPDGTDDFTAAMPIKSVTVKGRGAGAFSDTLVAASQVGKLSLNAVAPDNGGTTHGVCADQVRSAAATTTAGKLKLRALADPASSVTDGDFVLRLL